jgi:hypothetical protein
MIRWKVTYGDEPGEGPGFLVEWDGSGDLEGRTVASSLLLSDAELDALLDAATAERDAQR